MPDIAVHVWKCLGLVSNSTSWNSLKSCRNSVDRSWIPFSRIRPLIILPLANHAKHFLPTRSFLLWIDFMQTSFDVRLISTPICIRLRHFRSMADISSTSGFGDAIVFWCGNKFVGTRLVYPICLSYHIPLMYDGCRYAIALLAVKHEEIYLKVGQLLAEELHSFFVEEMACACNSFFNFFDIHDCLLSLG